MSIADQYLSVLGEVCFLIHSNTQKNMLMKVVSILSDQTMQTPKLGCSGQQTDVTLVQTAWNHSRCLWRPSDQ